MFEPISFSNHARLLNGELAGVVSTKAFVTVRHRNAWYGHESRQYRGRSALHPSRIGAQVEAEQWRASGSHFVIHETAGIVLIADEGCVLCVDFHADNPFGGWALEDGLKRLSPGVPLSVAMTALGEYGTWKITPDSN